MPLKLFRLYGRVHVTYTATSPEECYLIRQLLKLDSRWLYLQYSTEFVIDFSMISATTRSFIHPSLQVSSCNSSSRALIGAEGLCNLYIIVFRLFASSYYPFSILMSSLVPSMSVSHTSSFIRSVRELQKSTSVALYKRCESEWQIFLNDNFFVCIDSTSMLLILCKCNWTLVIVGIRI